MQSERREYATADDKGRRKPGRRMVKLPGDKSHVERSDSALLIARRIQVEKMEKRIRNGR
jgi:hypothetical protein